MKRLIRWGFYAFIALVVCSVAGVLLLDTIAKSAAESQIRASTGMDVKIGKLSIGLLTPTLSIEDLKLYNTAEFGGAPFLQMPELYIEYDRAMARQGKVHLKLVRLNLAEISIIKNKNGHLNYEALMKVPQPGDTNLPPATSGSNSNFVGIDTLNLTFQTVRLSTVDQPNNDQIINLGIKNRIFYNIKSEKDLKAVAFVLAGSGGNLLEAIFGPKTSGLLKKPANP